MLQRRTFACQALFFAFRGWLPPVAFVLLSSSLKRLPCAFYCRYLARNGTNKDTLREGGGIELLVGMLAGPEETAGRAAAALWSLSDNCPTNKDAVRECGGVPALVKLLALGPEADTTVKAAGAIGRRAPLLIFLPPPPSRPPSHLSNPPSLPPTLTSAHA